MSMQRPDVASTLMRCCLNVMCLLGGGQKHSNVISTSAMISIVSTLCSYRVQVLFLFLVGKSSRTCPFVRSFVHPFVTVFDSLHDYCSLYCSNEMSSMGSLSKK